MTLVIGLLTQLYNKYSAQNLTWADLIILAAQLALEDASGMNLTFCPGRTDAADGRGSEYVKAYDYNSLLNLSVAQVFLHKARARGLTNYEAVALQGRPRSTVLQRRNGYSGSWSRNPGQLSNTYFQLLLDPSTTWKCSGDRLTGECVSSKGDVFMTMEDLALKWEPSLAAIAGEFAADLNLFVQAFTAAWTKFVTLDRFDGPYGNLCSSGILPPTPAPQSSASTPVGGIIAAAGGGLVIGLVVGWLCTRRGPRRDSQMYQKVRAS